jgi:hypothetical protein
MTAHRYPSPQAFKQALEQRLRTSSAGGGAFARKRQLLVFDRFLARCTAVLGDAVVLKGGLVLELRLGRARTTKDVDLGWVGSPDDVLGRLREAARRDLGDFLTFEVALDEDNPDIQNDGLPYGQPFGVDVAIGEPFLGAPDIVPADDILAFAGIAPPRLRLYPVETHVAEKLHAYTMPRPRPNSRVKDLPDLALLATAGALDATRLRAAFDQTFSFRKTHGLPASLPAPPPTWTQPYTAMAREDHLAWPTLADVTTAAQAFLDPVLAGRRDATWEPARWVWRPR